MISLIWDMDGTLLNSYDSIIDRIEITLRNYNLRYERDFIRDVVLSTSTADFFRIVEKEHSIKEDMFKDYSSLSVSSNDITLMPYAKETLNKLSCNGIENYVFTHRGKSIYEILYINGITPFFKEVVDGECGYPRKPAPDAIDYLVNKYHLDKKNTYYVGDRLIDAECANNADIGMIFYQSYKKTVIDSSLYDYKITDLREIPDLFKI